MVFALPRECSDAVARLFCGSGRQQLYRETILFDDDRRDFDHFQKIVDFEIES
jgi:hypothetical protein